MSFSRILVRATNWVGDAVMSLPALQALRKRYPAAEICVLARPWVADIYARERFADQVIPYMGESGTRGWRAKWRIAQQLKEERFDAAILFQNAFEAALLAWLARIPRRIGYDRDGRGLLLTDAIPVSKPGEYPPHESHHYLAMLHRAGILEKVEEVVAIRLDGRDEARCAGRERFDAEGLGGAVIGVSPGAAFGSAKQWLPDRFAASAHQLAAVLDAGVAVFGSAGERPLCDKVARALSGYGVPVRNMAGRTSLAEFIDLAAACRLFLTNDSGAMHIASAAGVPTVAVFGATDHIATGPTGPLARIVRQPVECAPCKLRECPIDHRCMQGVSSEKVTAVALELLA